MEHSLAGCKKSRKEGKAACDPEELLRVLERVTDVKTGGV